MTTLQDLAAPARPRLVTRPLLVRFVSVVGTATSFYLLLSARRRSCRPCSWPWEGHAPPPVRPESSLPSQRHVPALVPTPVRLDASMVSPGSAPTYPRAPPTRPSLSRSSRGCEIGLFRVILAHRRARSWLLVLMRSRITTVTCGTRPPSPLRAWMPRSCRSSDMKAAFTPYALLRTVPE